MTVKINIKLYPAVVRKYESSGILFEEIGDNSLKIKDIPANLFIAGRIYEEELIAYKTFGNGVQEETVQKQ